MKNKCSEAADIESQGKTIVVTIGNTCRYVLKPEFRRNINFFYVVDLFLK